MGGFRIGSPTWRIGRESNVTASRASVDSVSARSDLPVPSEGERMFVHMPKGFHPRKQGDMGEMQAMAWLASIGAQVWIPIGHSPDVDVIAELDGRLHRVQVKSSSCQKGERFAVGLCTNGGNQSWTGAVSFFDHVPMRLPVRLVDRWSKVVHPLNGSRRQARHERSEGRSTPSTRSRPTARSPRRRRAAYNARPRTGGAPQSERRAGL